MATNTKGSTPTRRAFWFVGLWLASVAAALFAVWLLRLIFAPLMAG